MAAGTISPGPGSPRPHPLIASGRGPGAVTVREGGGRARVFVLRGGDRGALAGRLDVIAASATARPDDGLDGLARQLAAGPARR